MDKMNNRKAVSPVIATLLMIAIAVAASVVMYTWVNTMVANQAKQSQTAIRIEQVQFLDTRTRIEITIRNTGTVGAVIKTVYVYKSDTLIQKFDGDGEAYLAGELRAFSVTMATALAKSSAYQIKVVTDIGFSAEGTYYTPNV